MTHGQLDIVLLKWLDNKPFYAVLSIFKLTVDRLLNLHEIQSHTNLIAHFYIQMLEHPFWHRNGVIIDFTTGSARDLGRGGQFGDMNKDGPVIFYLMLCHLL